MDDVGRLFSAAAVMDFRRSTCSYDSATTALAGLGVLLVTNVLTWKDILKDALRLV